MGKAAAALEAALTVLSREKQPLDWARTQLNLGAAQFSIGRRKRIRPCSKTANAPSQAAWDAYKSTGTDQYDESFTKSLKGFDDALAALAAAARSRKQSRKPSPQPRWTPCPGGAGGLAPSPAVSIRRHSAYATQKNIALVQVFLSEAPRFESGNFLRPLWIARIMSKRIRRMTRAIAITVP